MDASLIAQLGDELYAALTTRQVVPPLTSRYEDITIGDAYHIQQRLISRRLTEGARVIGKKIGVTSQAVMLSLIHI